MNQLKEKALELRKAGYSYNMIGGKLGIAKSTLSNWLTNIPFVPNAEVLKKVGKAKLKSALYKQRIKFENITRMKREAKRDIGRLSMRDIFMIGIGLYLGEGSKSHEEVRIVNADPAIVKLGIRWLKEFGGVGQEHLRVAVHGYPDHDPDELINFWSRELKLAPNQFIKTQIDTRLNKSTLKRRKLPYGTAHMYIRGGSTLPLGVKNLHRKIMGWIDTVTQQTNAGVV